MTALRSGGRSDLTDNKLASTVIAGLKYPIPAAAACAYWSFSRVMYTRGYLVGPEKVGRLHLMACSNCISDDQRQRLHPLASLGGLSLVGE